MTKCECGCGEEVKEGNRFIQNHHRKGKTKENDESVKRTAEKRTGRTKENDEGCKRAAEKMTNKIPTQAMIEGRKKQAEKLKGRTKENNESVRKGAEKKRGRTKENHEGVKRRAEKIRGRTKENNEGVRKMAETLSGRTKEEYEYLRIGGEKRRGRTKENDEPTRIRAEKMRGRTKETHEGNRRQSEKMKGRKCTEETLEYMSKAHIKYYQKHPEVLIEKSEFMKNNNPMNNPESRKKVGDSKRGKRMSDEARQKNSDSHIGIKRGPHTKEHKRKLSEVFTEKWKDSDFAKKMVKSWNPKPNKPEKLIYNLLQNILPNEYILNIKGHVVIDGKVPDFININGQKKLIEFNGCYFHHCPICSPNSKINGLKEAEKRTKLFKKYGYETLVVWEHELEDMEAVTNKILEFHNLSYKSTTKQLTIE